MPKITLILLAPSIVRALCWFPDGQTVAVSDEPCDPNGNSTCCGPGWACLSNNICERTSYVSNSSAGSQYVRGSCTDPTWNSPNCPRYCDNPAIGDNLQGGIGMLPCPNSDLEWYCEDSGTSTLNCAATQGVFTFQDSPTTVTVIGVTSSSSSSAITSASSSSSSASLSRSSSSTASSTASSGSISSSGSPSSKSSTSTSTAIGAGLGVPLGLVAISIAGYLLWRVRRTRKKDAVAQQQQNQRHGEFTGQTVKETDLHNHDTLAPFVVELGPHEATELPAAEMWR